MSLSMRNSMVETAGHSASASMATMSTHRLSAMRSASRHTSTSGYTDIYAHFDTLTVDDLFNEVEVTEVQYIADLHAIEDVDLVPELLICHAALKPTLTKVLVWAEEAAPIYNLYVKQYTHDPDESEERVYLKRRPLVRLRFYSKFFKKLEEFLPNVRGIATQAAMYRTLVTAARSKVEAEKVRLARLQIDFSRVRSFDNLEPVAAAFSTKSITLRSYCQCHLEHRTGKTFTGLPVEILIVVEPMMSDALAICQLHEFQRFLLFPTFRRADLVYTPTVSDSTIKLTAYDGSTLQLEFSSIENRNVWAKKLREVFPPTPKLPLTSQQRSWSEGFQGLQISTASATNAAAGHRSVSAPLLEGELHSTSLYEEPELKKYIVTSEISTAKKRFSLLRSSSKASVSSDKRSSGRWSRVPNESKSNSYSSSVSQYRRLQQKLSDRQRSLSEQISVLEERITSGDDKLKKADRRKSALPTIKSPEILEESGPVSEAPEIEKQSTRAEKRASRRESRMSRSKQQSSSCESIPEEAEIIDEAPAITVDGTRPGSKRRISQAKTVRHSSMLLDEPVDFKTPAITESVTTPALQEKRVSVSPPGIYLVPGGSPKEKSIGDQSTTNLAALANAEEPLEEEKSKSPALEVKHPAKSPRFGFTSKGKEYKLESEGFSSNISASIRKITPHFSMSGIVGSRASSSSSNGKNDEKESPRILRHSSAIVSSLSPHLDSKSQHYNDSKSPRMSVGSHISMSSDRSDSGQNHKSTFSGMLHGLQPFSRFSVRSSTSSHMQYESAKSRESLLVAEQTIEEHVQVDVVDKVIEETTIHVVTPEAEPETPVIKTISEIEALPQTELAPQPIGTRMSVIEEPEVVLSPVKEVKPVEKKSLNIFSRHARKARAALAAAPPQTLTLDTSEPHVSSIIEKADDTIRNSPMGTTTTITTEPPSPAGDNIIEELPEVDIIDKRDSQSTVEQAVPEDASKDDVWHDVIDDDITEEPETQVAVAVPVVTPRLEIREGTPKNTQSGFTSRVLEKPPNVKLTNLMSDYSTAPHSPGYPPTPTTEEIETSAFHEELPDMVSTQTTYSSTRLSSYGHFNFDDVMDRQDVFSLKPLGFRPSSSGGMSPPPPTNTDDDDIPPPPLPLMPRSPNSVRSRYSVTSTVRDSKATIRFTDDFENKYALSDAAMSDDEQEDSKKRNEFNDEFKDANEERPSSIDTETSQTEDEDYIQKATEQVEDETAMMETPTISRVSPLVVTSRLSLSPTKQLSKESISSLVSGKYSSDGSPQLSRPCSPLKFGVTDAPVEGSDEDSLSYVPSSTMPSPPMDEMKIVLFRSNAFVYEWSHHKWDRISDKEVRVVVTVTEDSGLIEIWPITAALRNSEPNCETPSLSSLIDDNAKKSTKTRSVHFAIGGNNILSLGSGANGPILTIPLTSQSNIRRSTAFDVHVKRCAASGGITMFRTRTAVEADHMVNAMNSCKLDFYGLKSRPFSLSSPSIASSETSSMSSASSLRLRTMSMWHHPSLETSRHSTFFFNGSNNNTTPSTPTIVLASGEVLLVKDFKCRLFLRQNALKWRNLGPARVTVIGVPEELGGNKVAVKRPDGQVVFELSAGQSSFERVGKSGLAVHVMAEIAETAAAITDGDSRVAVYMLQFKGDKDTGLVYRAIEETV
ncbi:uncharacterized protein V1518DRAFT_417767 [Limtongia smithiae]|uniref:uncharacterized protein n=1 Tax=Limtongia smithiae TaxID=1125753 RepID=UPI0034CF7FD2